MWGCFSVNKVIYIYIYIYIYISTIVGILCKNFIVNINCTTIFISFSYVSLVVITTAIPLLLLAAITLYI